MLESFSYTVNNTICLLNIKTFLSESCSETFEKAPRAVLPLRTINRKVLKGSTVKASRRVPNNYLSRKIIKSIKNCAIFVKSN